MSNRTDRLGSDEPPSFTCPRCGAISWNPNDAREGYCGRCHDWTSLSPGVYDDGAGLHLDVAEMLRANGWPNTAARDMFGTIEVHDEPDDG
jgi:hypothetical protein